MNEPLIEEKIHTRDGRFYWREEKQTWYASVTTILEAWPKGVGLDKFRAEHGWEGSKEILREAGDKGTMIHESIVKLLDGNELCFDNYKEDEWKCLQAFVNFYVDYRMETEEKERRVDSDKYQISGTLDWSGFVTPPGKDEKFFVRIDWKSSRNLWHTHDIQLSTYNKMAVECGGREADKLLIIQLGTGTKRGYSVHTVKNPDELFEQEFLPCLQIWKRTHPNAKPFCKEFPRFLSLR